VLDDELELDLERLCYPYRNLSDNGLHHLDYAVGASTQREGLERSIERERRFCDVTRPRRGVRATRETEALCT
jgi:hypothetical protein